MESKEVRTMFTFKSAAAAIGAVVVAVTALVGVSVHAWSKDYLTFSQRVALPGVTLEAGTYVFERADANVPDIVHVLSEDRKKVYFMAFTRPIGRPAGLQRDRVVLLGEVRPGVAPPIKAWFPIGEH